MARRGRRRVTPEKRAWPVLGAPRSFAGYVLLIDVAAVVCVAVTLANLRSSWDRWGTVALLTVLALGFEEIARRAARIQLRLSSDMKRDMTSVWAVAGASSLRPGYAVLLLVPVLIYIWFRQQRPAGEILHRKIFNAATVFIGCLGAGVIVRATNDIWVTLPWMLSGIVSVSLAIVAYTLINRALVTVGLVILGARGRVLLGSADDNLIELATLCLGGMVSLAVLYQPWLAILVLPPMITLQRGALMRELETAATIDAKTGLLNAIAWEHLARRELARSARAGRPLCVLILDLDHFKNVNDRYGHLVGDAVLRRVGRCLEVGVREFDAVGRFGGEEFVIVLPEASEFEALLVAERLRVRVNEMRPSAADDPESEQAEPLSVSIGVASSPTDGTDLTDLLVAADSALYEAKARGRNRVMLARRGTGEGAVRSLV
jgi:diguanylate cyclase (GGDEF)-like protein